MDSDSEEEDDEGEEDKKGKQWHKEKHLQPNRVDDCFLEFLNMKNNDSGVCLVNEDNSAQNNEAKNLFYSDGSQKNSILSTGHKSNLSFVVRGNKVGIYSLYGSGINFTRSIQDIQTINGKNPLYPTNAILHDQESSYLLYDVNMKNNIVYKMDLGRGEVVEEWKVNDENLCIL